MFFVFTGDRKTSNGLKLRKKDVRETRGGESI